MKVSIITPSFNQADFIERTILSVLSQDWSPLEYVVFDGGSTDGTVNILKKYDDRIRWVSQRDGGQADAVNQGIMATNGEVIGWLNSDDIYYAGAVRRVCEFLSANPDIDIVYGMADHIDIDDRPFEPYPTEPWDLTRLQWTCFICQPALFFRRSVIARHGLLNSKLKFCMDYEYWLRLGTTGVRFAYLQQKLAGSRLYAENKTLGSRVRVHAEINDMFRQLFGRVPDRWIGNYAHVWAEARVNRSEHPEWFVIVFMMKLPLTSLRWNRGISADVRRTCWDIFWQSLLRTRKWLAEGPWAWITLKPGSRPRRAVRWAIITVAGYLSGRPHLRAMITPILRPFPALRTRLRQIAGNAAKD